jgi:hypothetical protein
MPIAIGCDCAAQPTAVFFHPRMASEHHGVTDVRQLEPPGFLAMNYGYQTPFATLVAQAVYGGVTPGRLGLRASCRVCARPAKWRA